MTQSVNTPLPPSANQFRLSWSSLSTYLTCPLKFYFRYIARVEAEFVPAGLVLGSAVHAAIQTNFERRMLGESPLSLEPLMEIVDRIEVEYLHRPIKFAAGDNWQTLKATAKRMLSAFLESTVSSPSERIIGCEVELAGPTANGMPDFVARLDLILVTQDELVVRDFKTSRGKWSNDQLEAASGQLILYGAMAEPIAESRHIRLEYVVITKTKSPAIQVHEVDMNSVAIDRQKRLLAAVWRAIEQNHFYTSPSPLHCGNCPYRSACRDWNG